MSKAFNMTGWRLGWVCGAAELVRAFAFVKDYSDSGQFLAIQEAAAVALAHPEITVRTARKYARRMEGVVAVLREKDWPVTPAPAGFFLYTAAPRSVCSAGGPTVDFGTAGECALWLLETPGIVCVPWDDVGAALRFSMTFEASSPEEEASFCEELRRRLAPYRFQF